MQIFVSCAAEDDSLAKAIASLLKAAGLKVWRHDSRCETASYRAEVLEEITRAALVVVIWGPASVASPWVMDEADVGTKKDALFAIEVGAARAPLGHRSGRTIRLPYKNGRITRSDEIRIIDGIVGLAETLRLRPARHIWQHRPRYLWLSCCGVAVTMLISVRMFVAFALQGVSPDPQTLRACFCGVVFTFCAADVTAELLDSAMRRLGLGFRQYRLRVFVRWVGESLGWSLGYLIWVSVITWLGMFHYKVENVVLYLGLLIGLLFAWLAIKYIPLLLLPRLQRELFG